MKSKKFTKTKKQEVIRIVLDVNTKYLIKAIQKKYKVSMSCIAKNLVIVFTKAFTKEKYKELCSMYYVEKVHGKETTIKPKIEINIWKSKEEKTKYISNLMYLYANKQLKNIISDYDKYNSRLCNLLNKELDNYWDLNNIIRQQKRAMIMLGINKNVNNTNL